MAVRDAARQPAPHRRDRGAERHGARRARRHPATADHPVRQPVRGAVPVLDGLSSAANQAELPGRLASARARVSAAAAVGDDSQVHGRLRALGIAAARLHAGRRGIPAESRKRDPLRRARERRSGAMISRREFVEAVTALAIVPARSHARARRADAPGRALRMDGTDAESVELVRDCDGSFCRVSVVNRGSTPVRLKEVVLFDFSIPLPSQTALYGEGFQMLSQTGGTLAQPVDFSQYTDASHYKMRASPGSRAYYGLLTLTPPG